MERNKRRASSEKAKVLGFGPDIILSGQKEMEQRRIDCALESLKSHGIYCKCLLRTGLVERRLAL
ncbi:hypothetical protein SADUNF_Sadunf14G0057400 [Salix dunnii]|uniref:Uncharacterized protein n=1 Tax=Salix dunnii TaxID=1413687 RepID=A0A835JGL0_9ROSI|nr:hypothetical protein SADUNF_Sadunf14G0057400 [Salix dunnii]